MHEIVEKVKSAGVVGAGGAGFPTWKKLDCQVDIIIANGAECEPLLQVDQILMENNTVRLIEGMKAAMEAVNAKKGVIATKSHYYQAVTALRREIENEKNIELFLMDSFYPAGDEKSLVYDITGEIIPSAKLPSDLGCVVLNIGTLCNIANALSDIPVTEKYVTVSGDVDKPQTILVPVGTSFKTLLEIAGFSGSQETHALIIGGPCMGYVENDWNSSVKKTTSGVLAVPLDHYLITQKNMPMSRQIRLAQAVCCQCTMCTQLCPRNAMGLNVEPHKVMRAAANSNPSIIGDINGLLACSSCGLCTYFGCTLGLSPSEVMTEFKNSLLAAGVRPQTENNVTPEDAILLKRVPTDRLMARMDLKKFDAPAPASTLQVNLETVRIPLSMHIGKPARPIVQTGQTVAKGQLIASILENELGADIHASIKGRISEVNENYIQIESIQEVS
ncbi:MAG: hypothetical protein PWP10_3808 [Clostridiales bacterium]|jgi:Na+-translocating ferredoxin:NAD+ oxidoreductase RnfC subunit|nr:hypothetical protein [Clostridiales bacterium]